MNTLNQTRPKPEFLLLMLLIFGFSLVSQTTIAGPESNPFNLNYLSQNGALKEATNTDPLKSILTFYQKKLYNNALLEIEEYLKHEPNVQEVIYYRGLIHVETGKNTEAIRDFETVINLPGNYATDAQWCLVQVFLKTNRFQEAAPHLEQLKEKEQFSAQAVELLQLLQDGINTNNDRYYTIRDNGRYEFYYWKNKDTQAQPITERTFYLETVRLGVIPEGYSYPAFQRLSIDEKRALLQQTQWETIAQMGKRYFEKIDTRARFEDLENRLQVMKEAVPEIVKEQETAAVGQEPINEPVVAVEEKKVPKANLEQKQDLDMPWIVAAIVHTDALKGHNIKELKGIATQVNSTYAQLMKMDVEPARIVRDEDSFPWIITAVTRPESNVTEASRRKAAGTPARNVLPPASVKFLTGN